MADHIVTDPNGRKRIVNCCTRCGKITEGVHTCTPNPVIERLTAELADYRKALEVRNKQLGVACMKHDLVHSLACGICLTETRDLAEHWAILAEQRRVELAECKAAVRKLAAIVMDEYPEGDERFEFAYVTKALMDGPAFCEKLNAAMKEAKP
jgi:hypothetical protein